MDRTSFVVVAIALGAASLGARAEGLVYKCSWRSYSEAPCSSRIVRTYEAPVDVPRKSHDVVAHRLPGETAQELSLRQRRIKLPMTDRDECARLDRKIPFEQERIKNSPHQEEIDEAQESLFDARKRFKQLRC